MKVTWDFSDFYKFAERLQDFDKFDKFAKQTTREITEILRDALFRNTPVLTGNLCASWGGEENYSVEVKRLGYGYTVTLYNHAMNNKSPKYPNFKYGLAVNDGHKTPTGGWVMGRFFVEKSVIETAESNQLESIIMREIEKWWKGV